MSTVYTCGQHLSQTPSCGCCGNQFGTEVSDPQQWLDAKVAETVDDVRNALADIWDGEDVEDTLRRWGGFNLNEYSSEPTLVRIDEDGRVLVSGWVGFTDDYNSITDEWETPEITEVTVEAEETA